MKKRKDDLQIVLEDMAYHRRVILKGLTRSQALSQITGIDVRTERHACEILKEELHNRRAGKFSFITDDDDRPEKQKVVRWGDRMKKDFYQSDDWRAARYAAIRLSRGSCCACGASPKTGAALHVDHIKPKSLYPELALTISNLQVLCQDCNLGKSNRDSTDWR